MKQREKRKCEKKEASPDRKEGEKEGEVEGRVWKKGTSKKDEFGERKVCKPGGGGSRPSNDRSAGQGERAGGEQEVWPLALSSEAV